MKLTLAILIFMIGSLAANGQDRTRFGITAGLNASQIQASLTHPNLLWRYNAGVAFEHQFTNNFALASELIYTRQGSSLSSNNNNVSDKYITAFDYITLPVLLRFRPKGERGFIEAGGQIGYLTSANGYRTSNRESTSSAFQHTNKIDAGLTGGIGYRLGKYIVVDLRYYHGMKPMRENYTAPAPQTGISTYYQVEKWYNRVWSLNFSYYFGSNSPKIN